MASYGFLRAPTAATLGSFALAGLGLTVYRKSLFAVASAEAPGSQSQEVSETADPPNMIRAGASSRVFSSGVSMVSLRLKSSEDINHSVKLLRFEFPESDAISGLSLTSSVLTLTWPRGNLFPVLRPYTPVSRLDEAGHLDLMVKRYPGGKASTYLHSLEPGQSLRFVAALKGYPWIPNKYSHVALIAGGAGITPIYQLIQGIFRNPDDTTSVTLVVGVNSDRDVILKEKLDGIKEKFPDRLKIVYTVSKPAPGSPFRKGYVTEEVLRDALGGAAKENTKVFVCGPPAMEASLLGTRGWSGGTPGILQQLGYKSDQIHNF
ncbi:related to cytochrome-b5 reductase, mitochondrial [Cephalotrichum gorgonifer]|uniref:NADH-cytochrome b5 reductase n=1 Tax=Cephalotrichum gorgonifer TaxID=2041049 RepID=A0AAE8N956_9PEZI|nr:related to cytochrome-b5 reductase, mitochondrial [Cephalotrichum gorgonifer]